MSKLGRRDYDQEISALARVPIAVWVVIITLISTVSTWGLTTMANSEKNKEQDAVIASKQDKDQADKDLGTVLRAIEQVQRDVREIRRTQIQELQHDHGGDK